MTIKDRFLSKMKRILMVEHIPRSFKMLKSPYLTKLSGNFLKLHIIKIFIIYFTTLNLSKIELIENIPQSAP